MPTTMNGNTNGIDAESTPLCNVVTPVGMLGYGLNEGETAVEVCRLVATGIPTAMILDSGSTDSGPDRLASGTMGNPRTSYYRDLKKLLKIANAYHVPLIFSSAGGDGSDEHVKEMLDIVEEIAAEEGNEDYSFKTIAIFSGIEKTLVRDRLKAGAVSGCGACVPPLTEEDIDASPRIVAQMGPEPFIDAMRANPDFDVIVGGRAYDPAPYVAYAAYIAGLNVDDWNSPAVQRQWGGFTHMGKILECGGTCAEPKSHGAISTVFTDGGFTVSPLTPTARCTPVSVAAHTMYEKTRPDILHGPGGYLDLNAATYEQLDDQRSIWVRGSMFHFLEQDGLPYQIKLEAGCMIGYRSMFIGSVRDPILIKQLDSLTATVKSYVADQHSHFPGTWEFDFHFYGKPETGAESVSREVFLIGEALASSQDLATSVAYTARIGVIHGSYPGQKATSGNFAFGIGGKPVIELGPCAKFSLYHLMDLKDGEERLSLVDEAKVPALNGVNGNGTHKKRERLFTQSVSVLGKGDRSLPKAPVPTVTELLGDIKSKKSDGYHDSPEADSGSATNGHEKPRTLGDLAQVVRSKNSGPYEITFDLIFASRETYLKVKESGLLSAKTISSAYNLPESDVLWCGFFDPAQAFKATIPRIRAGKRTPGGSFMENDVHGSQQHLALVNLKLPDELLAALV
ncbi:hypothetical protein AAE478_009032 [Parahypoxylon ruwenzoriense]